MRSRLVALALVLVPALASGADAAHELSAADVEAFLDGVLPLQLAREDIAGAAIAVVKDGQLLFARGYGYADVDGRAPVSAEETLFRPGSISKLFTWTAVMQLVEQGRLDLDRDVNDYLDFAIPATYPEPITLRHVMTHSPGFEETFKELFAGDETGLRPLGDYLARHVPRRIFPPGTTPAYSNYATAMAGYIVQRVSGQPYEDYVEEHILTPLGMTRSTFRQPPPERLRPLVSKGYELASGPAQPFEYVVAVPAGSASVSATDMARFMIAHLRGGEYQGVRILRPETVESMHSRQLENAPGMNAMALGFYEETRNGHRIIGHGGDTRLFHSDLHLVLDAGVGLFITYNSAGKREIRGREAVWQAFLDRYFPYRPAEAATPATAAEAARAVSGRYMISRRPGPNTLELLALVDQWEVSSDADGTLRVDKLKQLNGRPKKLRPIGPLLFREVNGQSRFAFKPDASGRLVMVTDFPPFVFHRARWHESSGWVLPGIGVCLFTLLATVVLWPVTAWIRRHYRRRLHLDPVERRLRLGVRLVCLADLAVFIGFVVFLLVGSQDPDVLSDRSDLWLRLIQVLGWLGVPGAGIALYQAFRSWARPTRSRWIRIGNTLVAVAGVGVAAFLFEWSILLGSLRY